MFISVKLQHCYLRYKIRALYLENELMHAHIHKAAIVHRIKCIVQGLMSASDKVSV